MKKTAYVPFKDIQNQIKLESNLENSQIPLGFKFKGFDTLGVQIDGQVPFEDLEEARIRLQTAGIELKELKPFYPKFSFQFKKHPNRIEFAQLAEQLGEQIEIGMSPFQICETLAKTNTNPILKESLADVADRLRKGEFLQEAFAAQKTKNGDSIFPITFIYALKIGAEIGALEDPEKETSAGATFVMLRFFAEAQKKADEIQKAIKNALIYPIFVFVMVVVAFLIEVIWIIPQFATIYKGLLAGKDDSLPWLTQKMLDISDFARSPLGIIFIISFISLIIFSSYYLFYNPSGIEKREVYVLKIPVFGSFYRDYHASTFCRNLSMLWEGEPNIAQRFETVATTSTNPLFRQMGLHIANLLMIHSPSIPDIFTGHYKLLGDEFRAVAETIGNTGNGQKQLYSYAKVLENRASEKLSVVVAVLQQMAVIIPAIFVGLLAVASYYPLFSIISRLSGGK